MAMSTTNGTSLEVEALTRRETLEQKYIELLEKRNAQLEALIANTGSKIEVQRGAETEGSLGKPTSEEKPAVTSGIQHGEEPQPDHKEAKDADKEKEKPRPRVRIATRKYDASEDEYEEAETTQGVNDDTNGSEKSETASTVYRRVLGDDGKIVEEHIESDSVELRRLYRRILDGPFAVIDNEAFKGTTLQITAPFWNFIYFWDSFESACNPEENDSEAITAAREDLKQVMGLIRKSQLEPYFKAREASLPKGTMPYEYLWTMFAPGTRVYAKPFLEDLQMLEVRTCDLPDEIDGKLPEKSFDVDCIGFEWDGSRFTAVQYTIKIKKPTDRSAEPSKAAINTLPVYPIQFHDPATAERQKQRLIERGRLFCELNSSGRSQCNYSGAAVTSRTSTVLSSSGQDDDDSKSVSSSSLGGPMSRPTKEYSGQLIIDAYSFLRSQENRSIFAGIPLGESSEVVTLSDSAIDCTCRACFSSPIMTWMRTYPTRPSAAKQRNEEFSRNEEHLMLCPSRALGYALTGKSWAQFRVSSCKFVSADMNQKSREYFSRQLQLDPKYKKMLLAFVQNHQSSLPTQLASRSGEESAPPKSLDVIQGKGQGLALLLHGPPGVGKTLTAETIALATDRPLLVVSVAEIGTDAARAEANLEVYFGMAERWGAILLIDEADVFLEERIKTDNPNRNMLVSVLLRCLEYYQGIIILTTNRIRAVDVAVQSRMHLAIQYKSLNQEQKSAIYQNLLDKIPNHRIKGSRKAMYKDISNNLCRRTDMNGRQIRNIVSAALALAQQGLAIDDDDDKDDDQDDDQPSASANSGWQLDYRHLAQVHETTDEFVQSLKEATHKRRAENEAP